MENNYSWDNDASWSTNYDDYGKVNVVGNNYNDSWDNDASWSTHYDEHREDEWSYADDSWNNYDSWNHEDDNHDGSASQLPQQSTTQDAAQPTVGMIGAGPSLPNYDNYGARYAVMAIGDETTKKGNYILVDSGAAVSVCPENYKLDIPLHFD